MRERVKKITPRQRHPRHWFGEEICNFRQIAANFRRWKYMLAQNVIFVIFFNFPKISSFQPLILYFRKKMFDKKNIFRVII